MDEQVAILRDAMRQPHGGAPIDISVSRQCGDCTVTMRGQLGAPSQGVAPFRPAMAPTSMPQPTSMPLGSAGMLPPAALAACSLAAGPSVLQPQPSLLSAEEETARRFDSATQL